MAALKSIIANHRANGFVNKTQGSYFYIDSNEKNFTITFYTTGLFDLYGIRRAGSIVFCELHGQLQAIGLDRTQDIFIEDLRLEFGQRSARESFVRGPMPEKLATIHSMDPVRLASY